MTTDNAGGVWTYTLVLARELLKRGVEVALAVMGPPLSHCDEEELRSIGALEAYRSECRLEWMDDPWEDISLAGEGLLELEGELSPDIVHLNSFSFGSLCFRAPKMVAGHSCVTSWWRAVRREDPPASWDRYRREAALGLAGADYVVAPSRGMLEALESAYGHVKRKRAIYNGRSANDFRPGRKDDFIFTAGRLWDEAKNINALSRIAGRLPWPVYAAGERGFGPINGALEEGAREDGVRMVGKLSPKALSLWLSRASIYALPAAYEPFGLSVLEAALAGCALVLGDIGTLREIWGNAAVFVNPRDHAALREALLSLIRSPNEVKRLSMLARQRALFFTPGRMAECYMDAYSEMLIEKGGGGGEAYGKGRRIEACV